MKNWTREELILAVNLYFKLPFGKLHSRNPEIIKLAQLIGRTPSAIALKLVNFSSLDPSLEQKGMSNVSKLDRQVWDEFYNNLGDFSYDSEKMLADLSGESLEHLLEEEQVDYTGEVKERKVKTRVQQNFFRKSVLASYDYQCCITGLKQQELLIASHIKPWAIDKQNRLNPMNGLALNALHDKAFDKGLITVTPDYKVMVSSKLHKNKDEPTQKWLSSIHQRELIIPKKFRPHPDFLIYHNDVIFHG